MEYPSTQAIEQSCKVIDNASKQKSKYKMHKSVKQLHVGYVGIEHSCVMMWIVCPVQELKSRNEVILSDT